MVAMAQGQATSPTGASAEILRLARQEQVTLLLSAPLAIEYEAVCKTSDHRLAAGLSEQEADIFVTA